MSIQKSASKNAKSSKSVNSTTSKTSSAKSSKKEGLKRKNLEMASAEVKMDKTLKYVYPKPKMSKEEKKTFRRNARAARSRYEKIIAKLSKSNEKSAKADLHKAQVDYKKWQKETLTGA